MKLTATKIRHLLKRKLATVVLVTVSVAAFATFVDDGGKKSAAISNSDFSKRSFSLKTPYNYRSNNLFNYGKQEQFLMLNTVVTYQKGNATYILPLKKKVLLNKIKFNPAPVRF